MPVIIDGTLGVNAAAVTTTNWTPTNITTGGNTTLGDASGDTVTINASTLSIPNKLSISGQIGVAGASATGDYALVASGAIATGGTGNSGYSFHSAVNPTQANQQWWLANNAGTNNVFTLYKYNNGTYAGTPLTIDKSNNFSFDGVLKVDASSLSSGAGSLANAKIIISSSSVNPGDLLLVRGANTQVTQPTSYSSGNDSARLSFYQGDIAVNYQRYLDVVSDGSGGAASSNIRFYTNSGSASVIERLRIDSNGRVGINNTNPVYQLEVGSATSTNGITQLLRNNGSTNLALVMAAAGKDSKHLGVDVTNNTFYIGRDSSTNDITVSASGKVGMSTSTPAYKLDVVGDIRASGLLLEKVISFTPTAVGWYRIVNGGSAIGGVIRLAGSWDNRVTDIELQFNEGAYSTNGSIQQTRYCSYNGGNVTQARVSCDSSNGVYLDIYISTATAPGPLSVYFYGPYASGLVASPVVGAVAGVATAKVLTLGHGFRTTDGSNFAESTGGVGIGTNNPTAKLHVNGVVRVPGGYEYTHHSYHYWNNGNVQDYLLTTNWNGDHQMWVEYWFGWNNGSNQSVGIIAISSRYDLSSTEVSTIASVGNYVSVSVYRSGNNLYLRATANGGNNGNTYIKVRTNINTTLNEF